MDDMNDLDKRRLKGSIDTIKNLGSTMMQSIDTSMGGLDRDAIHREFERRGLPNSVPASLLAWPNMGLTCAGGLLLSAGLQITQLIDVLKLYVEIVFGGSIISAQDVIEAHDVIFEKFELGCTCASPECPRSPLHIDQTSHAIVSALIAIRAFLPPWEAPVMDLKASTETEYLTACSMLLKHHEAGERDKTFQIAEFMMLMQLKAGVIQAISDAAVEDQPR